MYILSDVHSMCPCVATAERNGDLEKVITWHKEKDHGLKATAMAQSGLPYASIGKKPAAGKWVSKKKSVKVMKTFC